MPDTQPITPGSGAGVYTDEIASNLTGTVSKNGTTAVTGVGSAFLSELTAGQVIRIPGTAVEDRIVAAITTDTALTVTVAFTNTAATQVGQRVQHAQRIKQGFGVDGTYTEITPTVGLPIQAEPSTAAISSVAASATSVTLLASNTARVGVVVFNESDQELCLKYGATASATSYTYRISARVHWEMPVIPLYTGIIDGIWDAGAVSGSARITELTTT